uniref:Growth hormone secretagogue receptor type 1 n=1 Tax=Aceria tosichella TaxID=561515 RepID=A0A6G1SLG5_9ACAR
MMKLKRNKESAPRPGTNMSRSQKRRTRREYLNIKRPPERNDQIRFLLTLVSIIGIAFKVQAVACSVSSREHQERTEEIVDAIQTTSETNTNTTTATTTTSTTTANHHQQATAAGNVHSQTAASQSMAPDGDSVKFPLYMRLIATFVCLIIFTVGVCGNLLVPLVVIKTKYLRNSTNLFLINLSIADLLVLIVCMPTVLIELHSRPETWLLGEAMCKLSNFIEMLAANGSIFTILAISFERYYAICKPLKAGYKCTRLRATIIICVIWLLACILTSPILIMAKSSETIYIDGSLVHNCILETDTYWHKMYVFVSMFAFFCLPLLVLMLVYWLISRRLIRENVAMMDIKKNNILDNRNTRQITGPNSSSINGIHVASMFEKHSSTKSQRPLLAFLKSNQHRDNCGHEDDLALEQKLFNHHNIRVGLNHEKINSVLLAQTNNSNRIDMALGSQMNNVQRAKLRGGKALSLDCQGSAKRYSDEDHIYAPKEEIESLSGTHNSNSLSCCMANMALQGCTNNYRSSIVDSTTTTTATSMSNSEGKTCLESQRSRHSNSSVGGLFLANSRFIGYLLNLANLSSLRMGADQTDNINTRHAPNTTDANGTRVKSNYDADSSNRGDHDGKASVEPKMSTTSCDSKLINNYELRDAQGQGGRTSQKSFDIANMHSRLINAISKPNGGTVAKGISEYRGDGRKLDGRSHLDYHAIVGATSAKLHRRRSTNHTGSRGASLFSQPKRPMDGNNARIKDNRSSLHTRPRFKWVKGISVSSSTGSTYTNSTCLISETGSASPSLHISNRQQNSPSPPRQVIVQHKSESMGTTDADREHVSVPLSCSHGNSPDIMPVLNYQDRMAHFDGVHMDLKDSQRENSHYGQRVPQARAKIVSNSQSSSVTYHEAENICYSDGSSSPSLSIAADSADKPSWLESLVFQEQRNHQDRPQFYIQLQPRQSQQRRLSQHKEEQSDSMEQESPTDSGVIRSSMNEQASNLSCLESAKYSQPLEIVVKGVAPVESSRSMTPERDQDVSSIERSKKNFVSEVNKLSPPVKARVRRSLTEDRAPKSDIDEENLIAIETMAKRFNRDLPSPIQETCRHSIVSTNPKLMSKVNLIAMAHSLTDNLHHKRTGQRSGSHPIVSKSAQLVGSEHNGLHTEFMAVRDISKKQQMDSRRQVVAMLAFVVACFFLLFFPYRVFTIWLILSTEDQVQSLGMETYYNLTYFSRILIYLHSAINPIAYNLISTKFRRAFMSILLCRGAATRRNFNTDHRYQKESKNPVNNHSKRSGVANKSSRTNGAVNAPT